MKPQDFDKAATALQALCESPATLADLLDVEIAAAKSIGKDALVRKAEKLKNHFSYMLKYLVSNEIPNIVADTDNLRSKARHLKRRILREYNVAHSGRSYYAAVRFQRLRPEENLESLVSDYLSELERRSADPTSMMSNKANARLEELSIDIFERIRTLGNFNDHRDLIESILLDPALPLPDRVVWVGAIGLGLLEVYDETRVDFLMHLLAEGDSDMQVPAAVWLVMAVYACLEDIPRDFDLFPFSQLKENPNRDLFVDALYELLKLNAFNNLSPREKEEIVPSFESMIKNMNLPKDAASMKEMMKNPESIASAQAYDWVHRFNDAIRKGYDVQAASLGKLRHWPFFGKVSNWLLPFDPNHSALAGIADEEGAPIADMLSRMGTLIDSDKYALILSLSNIPASMRESALQGTMDQMGANSDEFYEALNDEAKEAAKLRTRINNYTKQVWRVLTTYPKHGEFLNDDWQSVAYHIIAGTRPLLSDDMLRRFGNMLMELNDGESAEFYFSKIEDKTEADLRSWALSSVMIGSDNEPHVAEYIRSNPDDIDFLIECVNHDSYCSYLPEAFQIAEEMESDNIRFLQAYVTVLANNDMYKEAADRLTALEYLDADHAAEHRQHRGRILVRCAQWANALEALENADLTNQVNVAATAVALWMAAQRTKALQLLESNKAMSELTSILVDIVNSNRDVDSHTRAMLHYLLDSWQYILYDTNPLNI